MAIKHGIYIQEDETTLVVPKECSASIPVVVGAAPINTMDAPASLVNVPILTSSATEAMAALGYSTDFWNYTLCQMMYATANMFAVSPVVYINVLDPSKHVAALEETECQVNSYQATVEATGILVDGLVVTAGGTALEAETDYVAEFDSDGYLVITLLEDGAGASATTLTVSGKALDPTAITKEDIIGAYDATNGTETGLQLIRQVYPKLGVVPGLIVAPGWSEVPEVGVAMAAKAASINGVFKAMALLDLDTTLAKKYTDCKEVKEDSGFISPYSYVLWPCDRVGGYIFAKSVVVAALTAYQDACNDDVPYLYPSNKLTGVSGQCLRDGTEVILDQDQANEVNGYGVATALNMNGWRLWGNYTGAYPSSSDAKDIWYAVRRMFNWQGNTFIITYWNKVDNPMNRILIESIVDSENIRCAAYAPDKWAGASIEYLADDNPATDILAGKMTFRQKISPYTPAQEIVNILSYDTDTLASVVTGGEE